MGFFSLLKSKLPNYKQGCLTRSNSQFFLLDQTEKTGEHHVKNQTLGVILTGSANARIR